MNLTAVATAASLAFALGRMVTQREVAAARREANTDALTGLPNRAALMRHLHNRARSRRGYVICMLDLNGFKKVNDTYGHRTGDDLLVAVAGRLAAVARTARLGGDEFVVVSDLPEISELVSNLQRAVRTPVMLPGLQEPVTLGTAVGLAAGSPGSDPRRVLHGADLAMYRSKRSAQGVPYWWRGDGRVVTQPEVRVRDRPLTYVGALR